MVVIEMENGGVMELELYPEKAPITVKNFEKLVKDGFKLRFPCNKGEGAGVESVTDSLLLGQNKPALGR